MVINHNNTGRTTDDLPYMKKRELIDLYAETLEDVESMTTQLLKNTDHMDSWKYKIKQKIHFYTIFLHQINLQILKIDGEKQSSGFFSKLNLNKKCIKKQY